MRSLRRSVRGPYVLGLIGQGGSFLASILPLGFSPHQAITSFVVSAAIATVLMPLSNLGLPMSYPSISADERAAAAVKASALTTILATALLIVPETIGSNWTPSAYLAAASPLVLLTSFDSTMIAWLVRTGNAAGIAENRFKYGLVNVAVTVPVCILSDWRWSLVASSSAVYAITMLWVCMARRKDIYPAIVEAFKYPLNGAVGYFREGLTHGTSYLLSALAAQVMNLATSSFGKFSAPWAAVSTICGGFGTVVGQFLTPNVNSKFGKIVREGRTGSRGVLLGGLAGGFAIASIAIAVSIGSAWLLNFFAGFSDGGRVQFALAVILFWGADLATAPIFNALSLLGHRSIRISWDVARLVVVAVVFSLVTSELRLLAMAAASSIALMVYVALVFVLIARRRTA